MTSNPTSEPRLRVAVFGAWSETNLGDRAIYQGVKQFFALPGTVVDTYRCGALRPYHASAPGICSADSPRSKVSSLFSEQSAAMRALKRSVRGIRQEWLVRRLMPSLAQADLVCVGGGELLSDQNLHFPQSLLAISRAVQALRLPLWCLGCSTGEAWSERGRRMIVEFLESCDAIAVRDHQTAAQVSAVTGRKVPLFGDFALPVRPVRATALTSRPFALAVNVAQLSPPWTDVQHDYEAMLVRLVQGFLHTEAPKARVLLFSMAGARDEPPLQRVQAQLSAAGVAVARPGTVPELEQLLDDSNLIVASRLHAAVISLARGRPVLGFSPSPKIGRFFASVGLSDFFFQGADGDLERMLNLLTVSDALSHQWRHLDQSQCWKTREFLLQQVQRLANRGKV